MGSDMFSEFLWFLKEMFRVGFECLGKLLLILFNAVFVPLDKLTFNFLSNTFLNKKAIGRNSYRDNFKITKAKQAQAKSIKKEAAKKDTGLRLVKSSKAENNTEKADSKSNNQYKSLKNKKVIPITEKSSVNFVKIFFKVVFSPIWLIYKMLKGIFTFIIRRLQPVEEEGSKIGRKCLVEEYLKEYERKKRYFN